MKSLQESTNRRHCEKRPKGATKQSPNARGRSAASISSMSAMTDVCFLKFCMEQTGLELCFNGVRDLDNYEYH